MVLDKKQQQQLYTGDSVKGTTGSVTFHLGKRFKRHCDYNDSLFDDKLWPLLNQSKTKQPKSAYYTGDGHIVVDSLGCSRLKKLPPIAMAPVCSPPVGVKSIHNKRRLIGEPIIVKLLLPLPLLLLQVLILFGDCTTLRSVGAQPPSPPPPPPVRSAPVAGTSVMVAAKRDLLLQVDGHFNFIDPVCQWKTGSDQIELLVMTLKCDAKPMIRMFENLMPYFNGPKQLRTLGDLSKLVDISTNPKWLEVWQEYLSLDSMIDYFYNEVMYILSRRDFCTYTNVYKLSQLRRFALGSRLLSHAYDLITINYHSICLIKALTKLPRVPYLVREVVDIYIGGVDKPPVLDLNQSPSFSADKQDEDTTNNNDEDDDNDDAGEFKFNVNTAVANNGQLKDVISLLLLIPFGPQTDQNSRVDAFKSACKEFLIEIDERWQSMEMMSKMLSTEGNGIERFNNYVMRTLIPTKHADVCSQLSAIS